MREFLDDFTKRIFEIKDNKDQQEAYHQLVKDYWRLEVSLSRYWNAYCNMEKSIKDAQEERRQKGSLELTEQQSLQKEIDNWDAVRRDSHTALIKSYCQLVEDYKKYFKTNFPWLDSNIFDKDGRVNSHFVQYNSKGRKTLDVDSISNEDRKAIGDWALRMVNEIHSKERIEEIKPLQDLLNAEYRELKLPPITDFNLNYSGENK